MFNNFVCYSCIGIYREILTSQLYRNHAPSCICPSISLLIFNDFWYRFWYKFAWKRDPRPDSEKNKIGDDFSSFLMDFGVPLGGHGKAFFLINRFRLTAFLDFCVFLVSRMALGFTLGAFWRLGTPFWGIRGANLKQKLVRLLFRVNRFWSWESSGQQSVLQSGHVDTSCQLNPRTLDWRQFMIATWSTTNVQKQQQQQQQQQHSFDCWTFRTRRSTYPGQAECAKRLNKLFVLHLCFYLVPNHPTKGGWFGSYATACIIRVTTQN